CLVGSEQQRVMKARRMTAFVSPLVTFHHIQLLHIAASQRLPGGSWEVTSLDVGLVALHQAQRYAVPP
ncbi:hypothetical protein, partial [Escherichia coli]